MLKNGIFIVCDKKFIPLLSLCLNSLYTTNINTSQYDVIIYELNFTKKDKEHFLQKYQNLYFLEIDENEIKDGPIFCTNK